MGNIIMQSQPYPLSVTFNVFRQMTISPKVSVIESQSKSLYIGLGPQDIGVLIETVGLDLIWKFTDLDQLTATIIRHGLYFTSSDPTFTVFTCSLERSSQLHLF